MATREELEDIRQQHTNTSATQQESRNKLAQQLAETRAREQQLEAELEKIVEKCRKSVFLFL